MLFIASSSKAQHPHTTKEELLRRTFCRQALRRDESDIRIGLPKLAPVGNRVEIAVASFLRASEVGRKGTGPCTHPRGV
jgi:hypothetical protein